MSSSFPRPAAPPTPTVIEDGRYFVVPEETQMLYTEPIEIEGSGVVQVNGVLIEVS